MLISNPAMPDIVDRKQASCLKVSVIVRTYNRGHIIGEALASALRQTYSNFEIVVVDDGSTDNTSEIVRSLNSDKIRYIQHPVNRGVGAAANTGMQSALGDLLAFLDSDDLWKSDYLERMVHALQLHPEIGGVFCDIEILKGNVRYPSTTAFMPGFHDTICKMTESDPGTYVLSSRQMYLCLLQELPIKTTVLLLRREVMSSVGLFDEGWPSGEDWEFFLRITRSYALGYLKIQLAVQRIQSDSTFLRYSEQDKISLIDLFIREKTLVQGDAEALRSICNGISQQSNHLAGIYLHQGRRRRSAAVYLRAFRETGESKMLLRLFSLAMPIRLRNALARSLKSFRTAEGRPCKNTAPKPDFSSEG